MHNKALKVCPVQNDSREVEVHARREVKTAAQHQINLWQ